MDTSENIKEVLDDLNAMHPCFCEKCGKHLKYILIGSMPTSESHTEEECILYQVHNN